MKSVKNLRFRITFQELVLERRSLYKRKHLPYLNIEEGKRIYYIIVNTFLHTFFLDYTDDMLPFAYRPGTDLLSKMVLTDSMTVEMITRVLVPDVSEKHYVSQQTEFMNKNKCDVLYAPHDPLSIYLPIFIEVQNHVDEEFLVRAVQYSALI